MYCIGIAVVSGPFDIDYSRWLW